MDTLLFALNAVLPILLLIALGYILKRYRFFDEHFLALANKFVFSVALPVLLFYTIYTVEDVSLFDFSVVAYSVIGLIILFLLGIIVALVFIKDKLQKGVIVQAVFRSNFAIIGIPLAQALGGNESVAVVAIISFIAVPLMNILSVIALVMFVKDNDSKNAFLSTIKKIVTNPLIISVFLGLIFLWVKNLMPLDIITQEPIYSLEKNLPFLFTPIKWVAQIASPFALIILGGTFEFFVIKELKREIFIGTLFRSFIAPAITLTLAVLLSNMTTFFTFSSIEYPAYIALFAAPTAVSSAIMAKQMNNDARLAVQLVVWTTVISIVTIFLIVYLFRLLSII